MTKGSLNDIPTEIVFKISTYLDLTTMYNLWICNKEIYNNIWDNVFNEKYRLIKLKISFMIFKEKIIIKQICTFIQTIVHNQIGTIE